MTNQPVPTPTADPLAALRDWHLPDPVSWWPPAPGWWVLAGLALLGTWLLWRRCSARRLRLAPRTAALAELRRLRADLDRDHDERRFAAGVSSLMRRLALTLYPRHRVAGLTGADWLDFLDQTGGGGAFATDLGSALVQAPYRHSKAVAVDGAALADLAGHWIRAQGGRA